MPYPSLADAFEQFRHRLPARARLYVGGASGEPLGLARLFAAEPELTSGLTFLGAWVAGMNLTDWAGFHHEARAETLFLPPAQRPSFEAGRTRFLPLSYSQAWHWMAATPLDGAVILVSPPDADGNVSLGVSPDFSPLMLARSGVPLLGIINPHMPAPPHSPKVPLSQFAQLAEDESPLLELPGGPLPPAFETIARHIAALVDEGDALQFGVGNVQQAILSALKGRRGLRIHSGMVSDPVLGMLDADPALRVDTGVATGTRALYDRMATEPRVHFHPVSKTHFAAALAAVPRLRAINSVIEVDLFGQANAEFINGRQVAGQGGLNDFLRGAALSEGGLAITALMATAKGGEISRIVPRLPPDAVTVMRTDMDVVITEYGTARLRGKSIDARAEALITIADPQHRPMLAEEWEAMRRRI
ncbi:MAG: 4-hydroxybutyrate coenzyme A transferase [Hyphomonas sp.]|nr:4-hydroxybutyrate coenzyme A transferase [Hyphomonas sp.]